MEKIALIQTGDDLFVETESHLLGGEDDLYYVRNKADSFLQDELNEDGSVFYCDGCESSIFDGDYFFVEMDGGNNYCENCVCIEKTV